MKSKEKILVFARKNDLYSKKFISYLKKNFYLVDVLYSEDSFKNSFLKFLKTWRGDYIFSFRNKFILSETILKKVRKLSINFHPSPPKYRGLGGINFAILKKEKKFGVTAHLISKKIDSGKILKVNYFKFQSNKNLPSLLNLTHNELLKISIQIVDKILANQKFLNKNIKWSKKIFSKRDLENIYNLNLSMKKYDLTQILRATVFKKFKPYFIYKNKKKYLN